MSVRLEDVLTNEDIYRLLSGGGWTPNEVRAGVRLAVEKAEKVEGWVSDSTIYMHRNGGEKNVTLWTPPATPIGPARHALLLLGPKYEPWMHDNEFVLAPWTRDKDTR